MSKPPELVRDYRYISQSDFFDAYSLSNAPDHGLFTGGKHTYIVSNETPARFPRDWSKNAQQGRVEERNIQLSILGGMDTALDLFCQTHDKRKRDNRILVFYDINDPQIDIGLWKIALLETSETFAQFIKGLFPLPKTARRALSSVLESEANVHTVRPASQYKTLFHKILSSYLNEEITSHSYSWIREVFQNLGWQGKELASIIELFRHHGQLKKREKKIVGNYLGDIRSIFTEYLLLDYAAKEKKVFPWIDPRNYPLVHRAAKEGRIKIIRLPLQWIGKSALYHDIEASTIAFSLSTSNALQYVSESDYSLLHGDLKKLPSFASMLLQYSICGYNSFTTILTGSEMIGKKQEMLMRNWAVGPIQDYGKRK